MNRSPLSHAIESSPPVIVLKMSRGPFKNYNYLVVDPLGAEAVIVDPAWEMDKIDQALTKVGAKLRGVLLTHGHPDHVHLAKPVSDKHDCPIWMSQAEIDAFSFQAERLQPLTGTSWCVGGLQIEPIFTPGHTPGSTCYRIGPNLFTGDTLFSEGCGLCPDQMTAEQLFASLQRLKQLPGHTRVFPGHSYGQAPGQTLAQLLQKNIYLNFTSANSFADFRLRKGQNKSNWFKFHWAE